MNNIERALHVLISDFFLQVFLVFELKLAQGLNGFHELELSLNRKVIIHFDWVDEVLPENFSLFEQVLFEVINFALSAYEDNDQAVIRRAHVVPKDIQRFSVIILIEVVHYGHGRVVELAFQYFNGFGDDLFMVFLSVYFLQGFVLLWLRQIHVQMLQNDEGSLLNLKLYDHVFSIFG